MTEPVAVRRLVAPAILDSPKSASTGVPSLRINTLLGLMSRWSTPRECAWSRARASGSRIASASSSGRGAPSWSASVPPSMSSVTMYGTPSSEPKSKTSRMFACFRRATARASCWNRARYSGSSAKKSGRILMATSRSSAGWYARYTVAMPPRPILSSSWYAPTLTPSRTSTSVLRLVGAAARSVKAEGADRGPLHGAPAQTLDRSRVKLADTWLAPAHLVEETVRAHDLAGVSDLVHAAHLDQRLQRGREGGDVRPGEPAAQRPPRRVHRLPAVGLGAEGPRERLGEDVVAPHRVADLDRAGVETVDLGRPAGQAAPSLYLEVAQCDQALEVVEGDRAMHACRAGHVLDAARLAVGVEAEEDVAPREVAQR